MTAAAAITFPFERGKEYSLAELDAFEADLLTARQKNENLSKELRAPERGSPHWIKLRNEELIPLGYYAQHKGISPSTRFVIMPTGSEVDIRLLKPSDVENLQITIADPKWIFPGHKNFEAGHYHRLSTEILNRDGCAGVGPINKNSDGLDQDRRMVSASEMDAYRAGLVDALERKFGKKYSERDLVLLIHARKYCQGLSLDRFMGAARKALNDANVGQGVTFKRIIIFDYLADYFAEAVRP